MHHLLLITDSEGRRAVELNEATSSIGRDSSNAITIDDYDVSRQHAILLRVAHPGEVDYTFRITDGNLQGKPSTNGLFINGKRVDSCILRHGDEILLGSKASARYITVEEKVDAEQLFSNKDDTIEHLLTLSSTSFASADSAFSTSRSEVDSIDYRVLARLASFPELFIHPIVELSLTGEITYCNPAAIQQFPNLKTERFNHPILSEAIETVISKQQKQYTREIAIGDQVFEQSLRYIPQSDLIRSYLVDITERKRFENELKALHNKLAATVEKRTLQFNEASSRLKQEEKALVASYATNRALLNAIPDPMFRLDYAGNFVNFKAPKQHTLTFDPNQCVGCHLSEMLPKHVANNIQNGISKALKTEQMQVLEFQLSNKEEAMLYFEARIAVSAPNEAMVIFRDITERKRGEAEIRNALDHERDLNEMKTRFVSMTSHEFRTPLTTILSSAELIEHYGERCSPEKRTQFLGKIKTAANHMTSLLNEVLLINKVDAGRAEFKPQTIDLPLFCSEIIEELQITTTNHQLQLHSHLHNNLALIDRKLMRHILTNLLSNAINYSPHGGDIILSLTQHKDEIELQIQDSGIGIPEESRATLFESFVRGSNVGNISGTGLGLAIVKKSVDLHQGKIECHSVIGEGTTFIIHLPTPKQNKDPSAPSQARESNQANHLLETASKQTV